MCYIVCMKSRTNVSIDRTLYEAAKRNGISLSRALEDALRDRLAELEAEHWLRENRGRIAAYSEYVAEHGVFSDSLRDF